MLKTYIARIDFVNDGIHNLEPQIYFLCAYSQEQARYILFKEMIPFDEEMFIGRVIIRETQDNLLYGDKYDSSCM